MIPKRFEDITFADIQALKDNSVKEGKTIEYKKEIPSNADSDKGKFLAGVSAFANTVGGDFIIGVETSKGVPAALDGVVISDIDAEKLRLEQIIQNGLEPRLPKVNIENIQSNDGRNFFIIRVDRSWLSPHKVKINNQFYGRNSAGKYPMDVSELRTAFMLTEQLSERIKSFHNERVRKIKENDELPLKLIEGGKLIFHLIPLSAFTTPNELNISKIYEKNLSPFVAQGWNRRINLDGVVNYSTTSDNENYSYTQVFRNGCIESVFVFRSRNDELETIPIKYYEEQLIRTIREYLQFLADLTIEPPIYLFLTFVNIKLYIFITGDLRFDGKCSDRNDLLFPEIIIDSFDVNPEESLRQLFDMIWNAFGYARCFSYGEDGMRIKQ